MEDRKKEDKKSFNPLNRGGDIHTITVIQIVLFTAIGFNPLNRGGDIHTSSWLDYVYTVDRFNPLNRGGDIHTMR